MVTRSKNTVSFWVGIGVVVTGIGLFSFWQLTAPDPVLPTAQPTSVLKVSPSATALATSTDMQILKGEIERLKSDRSAANRRVAEMEKTVATLRSQSQLDEYGQGLTPTPPTVEEELQKADMQVQSQLSLLEGTLKAETVDPQWTAKAESTLKQPFLAGDMTGVQLIEAECRQTLCRMKLTRDDALSPEEAFRLLSHNTPWQGGGFVRIGQGDPTEVTVFLSREGYSLPQVAE